jgi:hypothetical protein
MSRHDLSDEQELILGSPSMAEILARDYWKRLRETGALDDYRTRRERKRKAFLAQYHESLNHAPAAPCHGNATLIGPPTASRSQPATLYHSSPDIPPRTRSYSASFEDACAPRVFDPPSLTEPLSTMDQRKKPDWPTVPSGGVYTTRGFVCGSHSPLGIRVIVEVERYS